VTAGCADTAVARAIATHRIVSLFSTSRQALAALFSVIATQLGRSSGPVIGGSGCGRVRPLCRHEDLSVFEVSHADLAGIR
jgi:hypothetical protein